MEAAKPKILFCEDDTNLGMVLKNYLELNDYDVTLLKPLSYMIGSWKGTATIQQQGGASIKVNQEEKISWQLDSLLINIEGIGEKIR